MSDSAANTPASPASPEREILLSRDFDAPRDLVWEAMTSPEHVVHWWGPEGFRTEIETMDVRPGGAWIHTMVGPDGTRYPNKSIFRDVVRPERIVYVHGGRREGGPGVGFVATWTFEALAPRRTRVTLRMEFRTAEDRDVVVREFGAIEGGRQTLARLADFLAENPLVVERELAAPADVVWQALTDLAHLRRWYFPQLSAFAARVGFETAFTVTHAGRDFVHRWRVTAVVPFQRLAYAWSYAGYPGDSVVTFYLTPTAAGTRLTVVHRGLASFQPERHPELAAANFRAGWTELCASLDRFIPELGRPAALAPFAVTRTFAAPRALVWQAWTEREHLARWFGPRGFAMTIEKLDLRPGGFCHFRLDAPDGTRMWARFAYREIVPPQRIVWVHSFSDPDVGIGGHPLSDELWPRQLLATATFAETDGRTTVTLSWVPLDAGDDEIRTFEKHRGSMQAGWGNSLDQLDAILSSR